MSYLKECKLTRRTRSEYYAFVLVAAKKRRTSEVIQNTLSDLRSEPEASQYRSSWKFVKAAEDFALNKNNCTVGGLTVCQTAVYLGSTELRQALMEVLAIPPDQELQGLKDLLNRSGLFEANPEDLLDVSGPFRAISKYREREPLQFAIDVGAVAFIEHVLNGKPELVQEVMRDWMCMSSTLVLDRCAMLRILVNHGADINMAKPLSIDRWTPLVCAMEWEDEHLILLLMQLGAKINKRTPSTAGATAFQLLFQPMQRGRDHYLRYQTMSKSL